MKKGYDEQERKKQLIFLKGKIEKVHFYLEYTSSSMINKCSKFDSKVKEIIFQEEQTKKK